MIQYDVQYQQVLQRILAEGKYNDDRTGVGTLSVFDVNMRVNLQYDGERYLLPLLGLRKVFPRTAWHELFWMLSGSLDARVLQERNIKIWDGNSSREFLDSRGLNDVQEGFIGKAGYGKWFRDFDGEDQLKNLLVGLKDDPYSRRHMISLWHPAEIGLASLPPCHYLYSFMVEPSDKGDILHLKFNQRSQDFILANHVNMCFAAFFLTWVADRLGFIVGCVAQSITNCHIYMNHIDVARELLERTPIEHEATFQMPSMSVYSARYLDTDIDDMFCNGWEEVKKSLDYESHERVDPSRLIMAV